MTAAVFRLVPIEAGHRQCVCLIMHVHRQMHVGTKQSCESYSKRMLKSYEEGFMGAGALQRGFILKMGSMPYA